MKTCAIMYRWNPARPGQEVRAGYLALALALIALLGLWLRLRNLGALPLVGDEAIQALALRGLLEHGIPVFETGFVYTRALLYTYLQAVAIGVFGAPFDEFWLRFPSAVFGMLVIVPVYALARQLGGQRVALLAALFVAVSSWEIELSRYARFYTLFQLGFVTSAYCFYRGFLLDQPAYRYAFLLASLVTFFTHHLALLLFTLFLIPPALAGGGWRRLRLLAGWGGALAILWYGQRFVRRWVGGMGQPFDPGPVAPTAVEAGGSLASLFRIGLPNLYVPNWQPWMDLYAHRPLLVWALVLLSALTIAWISWRGARQRQWLSVLLTGAAVLFATGYQFGLAILALFIQAVWASRDWAGLRADRTLLPGIAACAVLLCFWLAVLSAAPGDWKSVTLTLFGVPNVLQHFVYWFVIGWPFLSLVVVLTAVWLLGRFLLDRTDCAALYLPAMVIVPAVAASFFQSFYESRYVFHLYPALVIMYCMAAVAAVDYALRRMHGSGGRAAGALSAGLLLLALLFSQDANPLLSWRIAERDFRSSRNPIQSIINWPLYAGFHADRELPAEYVRQQRAPGDRILALGPIFMHSQFHYYAGGVDAYLNPVTAPEEYGRWRNGMLINYVTGARILSSVADIRAYLQEAPAGVWVLGDSLLFAAGNGYYSDDVKMYLQALTGDPLIRGRDGYSFLARVQGGVHGTQKKVEN